MAKSDRLRAKLKSAQKRRRKRGIHTAERVHSAEQPHTSQPSVSTPTLGIDVEGIIVEAILRQASRSGGLRDSVVIEALRALTSESVPAAPLAASLLSNIGDALKDAGVDVDAGRSAADAVLSLALKNRDREVPDQFIRYLSLIAA